MFYVKVKGKSKKPIADIDIKVADTYWRISVTATKEAAEQHLKDLGYEVLAVTSNYHETIERK
jgi:ABC-type proline/glycine betaine transport system substrate-binding protein